jgi:hypothetical protein
VRLAFQSLGYENIVAARIHSPNLPERVVIIRGGQILLPRPGFLLRHANSWVLIERQIAGDSLCRSAGGMPQGGPHPLVAATAPPAHKAGLHTGNAC